MGLKEIIVEEQKDILHWIKSIADIKKDCGIKYLCETDPFKALMGYAGFLAGQIEKSRVPGSARECNLMANLQEKSSYLAGLNGRAYTHRSLSRAINAFELAHQKLYDYLPKPKRKTDY